MTKKSRAKLSFQYDIQEMEGRLVEEEDRSTKIAEEKKKLQLNITDLEEQYAKF